MKSGLLLTVAAAALLFGGAPAWAAWNFNDVVDPTPGTISTVASGINNAGQIVGSFVDGGGVSHGFSLSGVSYTTVDIPGAAATTASGVNNSGLITGYSVDNSGGAHGFTGMTGPTATSFDATNAIAAGGTFGTGGNATSTVGYFFDNALFQHGFVKNGAVYTQLDVPSIASSTQPMGINAAGLIVGYFNDGTMTHGFIDNAGVYTQLDAPLGAQGTVATSVNSDGVIGGYYIDGGGTTHGFVDFGGTFYVVDAPNASGTTVLGISDPLHIVGYYIDANNGGIVGFSAEVPEPATLGLFGLSAFGIAALRRRRAAVAA